MVFFVIDSQLQPARVTRHLTRARRLRIEVPGLVGNVGYARRLERTAATWPGVVLAEAIPRSGRLLIHYASGAPLLQRLTEHPPPLQRLTEQRLLQRLTKQLPLLQRLTEQPSPLQRLIKRLPHVPRPTKQPPLPQPQQRPLLQRPTSQPPLRAPEQTRPPDRAWHAETVDAVLVYLGANAAGLSVQEAENRFAHFGPNVATTRAPKSALTLLKEQVANFQMGLLLASAVSSAATGDFVEAGAIVVTVGLNAGIGYHLERRNEIILASWEKLETGQVEVLRGGEPRTVSAAELVPGDIWLCSSGDVVPADARVLDAQRLSADESALTGESEPRRKEPRPLDPRTPLADRTSMLFAGTAIVSGRGRAVIVATGNSTEMAGVKALVEETERPVPPLVRRINELTKTLAVVSVGAAAVSGAVGLLRGRAIGPVLRSSAALAVAAIPEGLPLVATAALVRSMKRLHARGMVVRHVAAAETLGGVTVICADKTGTLTRNEMALEVLEVGDESVDLRSRKAEPDPEKLFRDPFTLTLAAAVLSCDLDAHKNGNGDGLVFTGSPTERALVEAAQRAGLEWSALCTAFPRRKLVERSDGVHYVVSIHSAADGGTLEFVKGAPEQVLPLCSHDVNGPLEPSQKQKYLARNQVLAAGGLRMLAVAWRGVGADSTATRFRFLGLCGLRDQLREGAVHSVRRARRAGIRTLILTGDQLQTAQAVAKELELPGEVITGVELSSLLALPAGERAERLANLAGIARVTPADKLALVRVLRESGELVAMAGDGVNDAPALRAADVGVAVGAGAKDLARKAADIVMAEEDLQAIIEAVNEGRIVQDNLRRALRFLFATNLSELVLAVGVNAVLGFDALSPLQLLWLNLLTDSLPALALALEPGNPAVLDRPPAPPGAPLLSPRQVRRVAGDGALVAAVGATGLMFGGGALAFGALTSAQVAYASAVRAPLPKDGKVARNREFALLMGSAAGLQLLALTFPPLRSVLRLPPPTPLSLAVWAAGALLPPFVFSRRSPES